MGEHADDILEGRVCQHCGEWFHDDEEPGHPRSCCEGASTRSERNRRKRQNYKRNRAARLISAVEQGLTVGWIRHSDHHFSRDVNGTRVDWWPASNKYMVANKVLRIGAPSDMQAVVLEIQKRNQP